MSIIPPSLVKVYAEQLGYQSGDLTEDALSTLAQELDYNLRERIQDASKYMVHSRRHKLTVDDLNTALRDRNQPQLYGYDPMEQLIFRAVPNSDIFYVPGDEVNLTDVLQEPLPKAPLPPALTCHALAIEGVQPAIPENPVIHTERVDASQPMPSSSGTDSKQPTNRRDLAEEAEVKPLVKHVLSKELSLFYDTLVNDLMAFEGRPEASLAALKSLEQDAGLQQLLPYLLQFVAEGVVKNLRSSPVLLLLMKAVSSLIKNQYLFIEPYLHQLMPPVLTCLVGKRLSDARDDAQHWLIRDEAASIIAALCSAYGTVYNNMVPRIAKTMLKALTDPDKPLTTHYGAIVGIAALGPQAVDTLLIPLLPDYHAALSVQQGGRERDKVVRALERCAECWHAAFDECEEEQMRKTRHMLTDLFRSMRD
jgi:transcription initiation factor TFIID subunit 6